MRAVLLGLLCAGGLAGCSSAGRGGPAWPAPSPRDSDGGESLRPHDEATSVAVTATAADDAPVERAASSAAASAPAAERASTAPAATPEEPLQTEEIVIEIDD